MPSLYADKPAKLTDDKSTSDLDSKILEELTPCEVRVLVHSEVGEHFRLLVIVWILKEDFVKG